MSGNEYHDGTPPESATSFGTGTETPMLVQETPARADNEVVTKERAEVNMQANTPVQMAATVMLMHSM